MHSHRTAHSSGPFQIAPKFAFKAPKQFMHIALKHDYWAAMLQRGKKKVCPEAGGVPRNKVTMGISKQGKAKLIAADVAVCRLTEAAG